MYKQLICLILCFIITKVDTFAGVYHDFVDLDFQQDKDKTIRYIKQTLEKECGTIEALGLSSNGITSEDFITLTSQLNPQKFTHLKVLDISGNQISSIAVESIEKWLELTSKPYIKLTGTPLAVKDVATLYKAFKTRDQSLDRNPGKAGIFMKRVIFISQGYVEKASSAVQVYKDLKDTEVIPENWGDIHRKFYKAEYWKGLLRERERNGFRTMETKIQQLSLSQPSSPQRKLKASDAESAEESSEERMTFSQALDVITFK